MSANRLLNTVLQYYQDTHDNTRTEQIIGTTVHLLTQLSNPLNLGVLTSQLLTAPAIWNQPDGLRTCVRIINIYNTAAHRVRERDNERAAGTLDPILDEGTDLLGEEWVRAVVKGADDRSRRWQHLLVLTGVLMGMEENLSASLRQTLESAVVTAANLALDTHILDGPLAAPSIVMALGYAFPLLSDFHKAQISRTTFLPVIVSVITGPEGFGNGQFLDAIRGDIKETPGQLLSWHADAPSFQLLQELDKRPIMGNMGPVSRLAGFAVEQAQDTTVVLQAQETLFTFSRNIFAAWTRLPWHSLDPAFESARLSPETLQTTWPTLWPVLRKLLFGVVAILQTITSRSLLDPLMFNQAAAPGIAASSLRILRELYFISSRSGNSSFQIYTFTYMTSVDVISHHPAACEALLAEWAPDAGSLASMDHMRRLLDLFTLNLAEHLPLSLPTGTAETLVIEPALSYCSLEGPQTQTAVDLFEAAHSAILSVLSCPQHSSLTIRMAPFYVVKLFESFPAKISPRQFRVAFKTVMQIVSPPFPVAAMNPDLSETLLEMIRYYMATATTTPLPATPDSVAGQAGTHESEDALSYQSSLALALIDSFPFLPLHLVEHWLTVGAQALNEIEDPELRRPVRERFVDILVSGELDVDRAAIGVTWWGTKGGRELVLFGRPSSEPPMMSGAIGPDRTSRL